MVEQSFQLTLNHTDRWNAAVLDVVLVNFRAIVDE